MPQFNFETQQVFRGLDPVEFGLLEMDAGRRVLHVEIGSGGNGPPVDAVKLVLLFRGVT